MVRMSDSVRCALVGSFCFDTNIWGTGSYIGDSRSPLYPLNNPPASQTKLDVRSPQPEHQIPYAAGLLKQAKYEVFKATRRANLMEKKATHQTSIEAFFVLDSDDN